MNKKIIASLVIIFLAGTSIFLGYRLYKVNKEVVAYEHIVALQETNTKIVNFTKMLIEEVLKANGPINFDTRLQLENSVRDLNDPAILTQWNAFVNSADSNQAQVEMKNLLDLLVQKINIVS